MSEVISAGTLYIVSTPIGNLDDITHRAIHVLSNVDLIAAEDTRKTGFLLKHYNIHKPLLSFYSYNESRRVPELIEILKSPKSVALVSDAGTPGISDPAYSIISAALSENIPVVAIPGPAAFLPALITSGLPTDRFVFEGFLPVKKGRKTKLETLRSEERTVILYESPHRLLRTLNDILEYFGNREVAVARELTKKFEEVRRGSFSDMIEYFSTHTIRGEFVLIIAGKAGYLPESD